MLSWRVWILAILLVLVVAGYFWWHPNRGDRGEVPAALAFAGPSTDLNDTVIVPTLDTPIPRNKSAIWCGSFQLAWDRLRQDLVGEPIRIAGAEAVADRLNKGTLPADNIVEENYSAKSGLVRDGVVS